MSRSSLDLFLTSARLKRQTWRRLRAYPLGICLGFIGGFIGFEFQRERKKRGERLLGRGEGAVKLLARDEEDDDGVVYPNILENEGRWIRESAMAMVVAARRINKGCRQRALSGPCPFPLSF
ncbi:uncharacterized protein LOC112346814 [Selaginella moellendorffii]|uniref:uncharacterized protein LOC112346814 n=1 Tax=Selaginella moellendorffii TaxID=88036 RepID=UPI000D1CA78F|nr:uncharacterized protein LOC112346814 [Selaginella moellendorffii]|eukprot:XP_024532322.1 uncharacterized protein LOC112346814 [Selaginella moellendorffii]